MGPISGLDVHAWGELIGVTLLAAAAFSTFGLLLGTMIEPAQIGLMFGFIVAPMIFFGCAYYPWQGLSAVPVMKYAVLVNPLVYDGYPSIGCEPCTRRVAPGEDPRSGRWAGTGKTECGIHS